MLVIKILTNVAIYVQKLLVDKLHLKLAVTDETSLGAELAGKTCRTQTAPLSGLKLSYFQTFH